MRARSLTLLALTVSGAFATGWLLARLNRHEPGAAAPAAEAPITALRSTAGNRARDGTKASAPGISDPVIQAALEHADLAAAAQEIVHLGWRDFCLDTRFAQLIEALPESRLSELPALLALFTGDEEITRFILTPWAERQPAAALAWAQSQGARAGALLPHLLTGWARRDPDAATVWMTGLPLSSHSRDLQTALIRTLSESNPGRALALLRERGWTTNAEAIQSLLKNQGSLNPAAALETLRSLVAEFDAGGRGEYEVSGQSPVWRPGKAHPQFSALLGALLSGASGRPASEFPDLLARLTPLEIRDGAPSLFSDGLSLHPDIMESLARHGGGSERNRALLQAMATSDGYTAIGLLEKIADPALRADLLRQIDWSFPGKDYSLPEEDSTPRTGKAVLEALDTLDGPERSKLGKMLTFSMAHRSPEMAGEIWSRMDSETQLQTGSHVFKTLAEGTSGGIALNLWKSSSPQIQAATLKSLAAGLGTSNPAQGVELAMSWSDSQQRMEALAATLSFWARNDAGQASAEMERLLPRLDLQQFQKALDHAGEFPLPGAGVFHHPTGSQPLKIRLQELAPAR